MVRLPRAVVLLGAIACGDNVVPATRIVGQVWSDDNGNGVRDPGEAPVAGATLFINLDIDPSISFGDPVAKTADDGTYELILPGPGKYDIRPHLPLGFRFPSPPTKPRRARAPIIGGSDTKPGDYGFMVAIGSKFQGSVFQFCGGVLIDDLHVVTAAHCSEGEDPADVGVIAGTLDPFEGGEVFDVERITIHPSYFTAEAGHDIAVWTLAEPISLAELQLTTVEMLSDATIALAEPGTLATAIGWGVSDRDSPLLQQVHLPLVSADECAAVYPDSINFDSQICAGASEGGIDTCQGDSGGPLLVRDDARQVWLHAGITSYGDGCALPGTPGVYARVSALSKWVSEQVTGATTETVKVRVVVEEIGDTVTVDLATRATTRPQIGAIAERWQLTNITLPGNVPAATPLAAHWVILGDTPTLTGFTCRFEPDLAASAPAQDIACDLGTTDLSLPGYPTGLYVTHLTVTRGDLTLERRVDVSAGTPTTTLTAGAIDGSDPVNPDFGGSSFRVDYYDVTGLDGTRAFAVETNSGTFFTLLTLYDLDARDFVTGGGILASGTETVTGERIVVVPEAGRRYLVGVTSFDLGSYSISITNDGTLTPH